MEIKEQLGNIVWHIETNREILGDKRTLDDVFDSLKRMVKDNENPIIRPNDG